ncbi:MAG: PKD domain-containing protein [Paludibacteraceae bacterium]
MKKILFLVIGLCCAQFVLAQCFDMTSLSGTNVICTTGSYNNPYQSIGAVSGRHTIMSNTSEYDSHVPSLLTIPTGESNSIRLGNDRTGSEAESITFRYTVDNQNPILLLKYAAVMEDPGHSPTSQPRLCLQVLNSSGALIDPDCTSFDFIASPSLGWNSMNGGSLLWKDWTSVGVDLSSYIGQSIQIRLTNYDCNAGGHFGYAYIHLSCAPKRIKSQACGNVTHVTFSAPAGFEYFWYTLSGTSKIAKGVGQTITVPMDGTLYYCDISQIGKPECSYTTSVVAQPRYPIASFEIQQVLGCVDTLYLKNTSGVSIDGITKNSPLEECDEAVWDLGDGRTLTTYQLLGTPITYANAGTYTITLTVRLTDGGCTQTISKQVTVRGENDRHVGYIYASTCENSFYRFNGQNLNQTGTYTMTTLTPYGCDSTTILYLTANPSMEYVDTLYLCKSETYSFHGQTITHAGTYYANYQTVLGCDSVYKLVVKEVPTYYREIEATICDSEEYDFNGQILQKSGVYIDSAQSVYGCDSVIKLTLHVNPSYLFDTYVETCHNDTFTFRGKVIDHPGIFYDSLYTHLGCDSVYRFIYNKTAEYIFEHEETIYQGESYYYQGQYFTNPGLHKITYQSVSGCDSIYQLRLIVLPKYQFIEKATTCDDEPYEWRGALYDKTGIYYDSLRTTLGHDSIYVLDLTVHKSYLIPIYVETCEGNEFDFRGKQISQTGIYYDSLYTHMGCDSVFMLVYNIVPTFRYVDTAYFCRNTTYDFRGRSLTLPGVYYDSLKTVSGCDSIYKLVLRYKDSYEMVTHDTVWCSNEPYEWRTRTLTKSGVYYDSLVTMDGCDSVYILHLEVYNTYLFTTIDSTCDIYPYAFRGKTYAETGIYYDSLTTIHGCDSVYRLQLEVFLSPIDTLFDSLCYGDTLNFYNLVLYKDGYYSDTIVDPITGHCAVHNIMLGVRPHTEIYYVSIPDLCADDESYQIFLRYRGERPYAYSLYYSPAAKQQGFADVLNHPYSDSIPIIDSIPQYPFDAYIHPDQYMVRLELNNGYCSPQKYGVDIPFVVRYPSWIIEQNWNNVVALLNETYNGGFVFDKYEWYVNGRKADSITGTNLYSQDITIGDEVVLYLQRQGEDYSIPTCPIYIYDKNAELENNVPIFVYPTYISQNSPKCNLRTSEKGIYQVFDCLGRSINSGTHDGEDTQINLPLMSGVYLVTFQPYGKATQVNRVHVH